MKKSIIIDYHEHTSIAELNKSDQELIKHAQQALQNAYAPYSKFYVGAALQLENGTIIIGNNQENIAYPSGLCAERVALFHVGANFPTEKIETLAIAAEGNLIDKNAVISPCGSCRQVLFESEKRQQKNIRILIIGMNGKIIAFEKSTDLLTFAFGL